MECLQLPGERDHQMKILVFSYWSIREGITKATVVPLVRALSRRHDVEKVYLCTVEQGGDTVSTALVEVIHTPFITNPHSGLAKAFNLVRVPRHLSGIIRDNSIDVLWCKGAPAGGAGALVNAMTGTPYVVDSFEPHSEYMADSGTWSRLDPKFVVQRFLERLTVRRATALLPVSHHYSQTLLARGIEADRVHVLPCIVDQRLFAYDAEARSRIRQKLNIPSTAFVGIYVGKYGGLYYDREAFVFYRRLFDQFGLRLFLIIITEIEPGMIEGRLQEQDLPRDHVFVIRADHKDVGAYLSAADFGISTIKPVPAMRFCSPIKHGEYWAADLPVISTLTAGDDADVIKNERAGVLLSPEEGTGLSTEDLETGIAARGSGRYSQFADKYRSIDLLEKAITFALGSLRSTSRSRKG